MEHHFIHRLEVLRRAPAGEEDGTPIMGAWEPIEWATGQTFGACRLDEPRDVTVQNDDHTRTTIQRSTVLTSVGFPGKELDRLRVTTDLPGTQEWIAGGISVAAGQHGAHHVEVNVSREVHR